MSIVCLWEILHDGGVLLHISSKLCVRYCHIGTLEQAVARGVLQSGDWQLLWASLLLC